MPTAKMPTPL